MKYKAFVEKLATMGLKVDQEPDDELIWVYNTKLPFDPCVATVDKKIIGSYNTSRDNFNSLSPEVRIELANLVHAFSMTPTHFRYEEPKWYLSFTEMDGKNKFLFKSGMSGNLCSTLYKTRKDLEDTYKGSTKRTWFEFNAAEIDALTYEWRPAEFGGRGFTKAVKV